jgi:type II secretory pathway component PulK
MAVFPALSRSSANNMVQQRSNTPVKNVNEINTLLTRSGAGSNVMVDASLVNINSQFWIADSAVKIGNNLFKNTSLIQRSSEPLPLGNYTQVIWNKTNRILSE